MTPIQATMIQTWLLANQASGFLKWDDETSFWLETGNKTLFISLGDEGFEFAVWDNGLKAEIHRQPVTRLSEVKALLEQW